MIINKLFEFIIQNNFSDMHIWENRNVYIRDKIWNIEKLNTLIKISDILDFAKSVLTEEKYSELNTGIEVDSWLSYLENRFRLNFYYDREWLNVAIRKILSTPPNIEEVWIPPNLKKHFLKSKWLILVTWPTWSWKSTTLAAIVRYINENKKAHIITLEDPVEYIHESNKSRIVQREVWRNTSSWLNGIKYALRQDPDVIVVWEMRDYETIGAAITLVETGHLVLSTLHSIDTVQTVTRIIDSFPYPQQPQIWIQLSMALEMIISQRLVAKADWNGKVAVREVLVNNSAIANIIREKKLANLYGVLETHSKDGMITMEAALAKLVIYWTVKYDEVVWHIKNVENFQMLLNFYNQVKSNELVTTWK